MRHTLWVTRHLFRLPMEIYDKLMDNVCVSELNTPCLSKTRIFRSTFGFGILFCLYRRKQNRHQTLLITIHLLLQIRMSPTYSKLNGEGTCYTATSSFYSSSINVFHAALEVSIPSFQTAIKPSHDACLRVTNLRASVIKPSVQSTRLIPLYSIRRRMSSCL